MNERNTPAKVDSPRFIFNMLLFLGFIALFQVYILMQCATGIIAADVFTAVFYGVLGAVFYWATGSLYVSLPLAVYFHIKYRTKDPNYIEIERVHKKALNLLKRLPVRRHMNVAVAMSNLGLIRLCQGECESAAEIFQMAKDYLSKCPGKRGREVIDVIINNNLAVAYLRQNKCVEAELVATNALEVAERPGMKKQYSIVEAAPLAVLAASRLRLGEYEGAIDYGKKVLELYETAPLPKIFTKSTFLQGKIFCLMGLALAHIKLGRVSDSFAYYDQAFALIAQNIVQINTLAMEPLNLLANAYLDQKILDRAETLLELSYSIAREHPFHPDSRQTLNYYEKLLLLSDRQSEVADMRLWLRHIEAKQLTQS